MLTNVPPSVFYGMRATRAKTKAEPVRAAPTKNTSTTRAPKEQKSVAAPQKNDSRERQLRSGSKKTNEPTTSAAAPAPPSSGTQRTLRARKIVASKDPKQKTSKLSKESPKVLDKCVKRTDSDTVKTPQHEKNPIYKQAIVVSKFAKDVKASGADEYEFQVETPEGTSKKPKKRQPRQKVKMQTLWGLTVRPGTKQKSKPRKKVVIQEPENVLPVRKVIQPAVMSKEVQPSSKKTPPLQERAANTIGSKGPSNMGGSILENRKRENLVSLTIGKTSTVKSASENVTKAVNLKNKQTDEEAKENNPHVTKVVNSSSAKVFKTPFKQRSIPAPSNSTPLQGLHSPPPNNTSPIENSGLSPAINNMSVMFSPIRGNTKSTIQSVDPSRTGKSIHSSTPVQSIPLSSQRESTDPNICLEKGSCTSNQQTLPAASSMQTEECVQSLPSEHISCHEASHDSEDEHLSDTQCDFNDSEDLFNPDILQDLHNGAKPSIPARMLGGRKPTMLIGSRATQLNQFVRQGTEQLVPVSTSDSCWRVIPTTKYIYPYEATLDDCFGFDNGPDAYAVDVYPVKQPVIQRKPYFPPERPACPTLEKQPSPQPDKEQSSQRQKQPCPEPSKDLRRQLQDQQQKQSHSQLEKPLLRSQVKLSSTSAEPCSPHPESTATLSEIRIDEMLSTSLSKLRRKKKYAHDSTIFNSITSNEDGEASSTSQRSDVTEDTSSRQQVSLFEDAEDGFYKSPFTKPPRRSYAHLRRLKRAFEEDQDEQNEEEENSTKTSKPNKTIHKRKKMVQSTLLNQWAKDLSSHFAEVDDVELITE